MSNSIIQTTGDIESPTYPTDTNDTKNKKPSKIVLALGVISGLLLVGFITFLALYIRSADANSSLQAELDAEANIIDGFAESPKDGFVIRHKVLDADEVKLLLEANTNAGMAKVLKDNPKIREKLEAVAQEIFPDVSMDWVEKVKDGEMPNDTRPKDGEKDTRDCTDFANIRTIVGPNGRATSPAGIKAEKRGWHADFHPLHPLYRDWKVVGLNIGLTQLDDYTGIPFELKNPHTNQRHRVRLGPGDVAAFRPDINHRVNHDMKKSGFRRNLVADAYVRKPMTPLDYHVDARPEKTLDWDKQELAKALGW